MSPAPILIVGGSGVVGRHTAKWLRQRHPDSTLLIGGRNLQTGTEVAAQIVVEIEGEVGGQATSSRATLEFEHSPGYAWCSQSLQPLGWKANRPENLGFIYRSSCGTQKPSWLNSPSPASDCPCNGGATHVGALRVVH